MLFLVCVIGLVGAFLYREKAPLAFSVVLGSLAVMLLVTIAEYPLEWATYKMFGGTRGGGLTVSRLLGVQNMLFGLARAAATGGLAAASFLDRGIRWPPSAARQ